VAMLFDLAGRQNSRQRNAAPRVLDNVRISGTTPSRSHATQGSGAPQPGLRFVDDEEHAPLPALLAQGSHVAFGEFDQPAGTQDGLGDESPRLPDDWRSSRSKP